MATTELPVLNEENAPAGTALRPYDIVYGEAEILAYLARQHEPIDGYRLDGQVIVPPGILLACYARLIHDSFFYETGVHVSSEMTIHRLPLQGELVRVSGQINRHFERNGNKYVSFNVEVGTPDGTRLAEIEHVSIYRLQPRGERAG